MRSQPPRPARVFILSLPGSEIYFDTRTNEIQSRIPALPSPLGLHARRAMPQTRSQRPTQ